MTTLIKNATVVTDGVIENIDVLINEDVICYIGKEATDQQPKATHDINVVDATGCFLCLVSSTTTCISASPD